METMKTHKKYIAAFCIAVIAIACGTVYLCFNNEKENVFDDRIFAADDVYIKVNNIYSGAAGRVLKGASLLKNENDIKKLNDLCKKIELVQPIENGEKWYEYGSFYNQIYMEIWVEPSDATDCEKEFFVYRISLGEKETGYEDNAAKADDGKKLVYIASEHYYAYDKNQGRGIELYEQLHGENRLQPDTNEPPLYPGGGCRGDIIYISANEVLGEKWRWGYYCQMDEEDYNALFDLQYNITKSVGLNKSKYQKENQ